MLDGLAWPVLPGAHGRVRHVPLRTSRGVGACWLRPTLASLSCAKRSSIPDAPRPSSGQWLSNPPTPANARIISSPAVETLLSGRAGHVPMDIPSDGHAGRGVICGNRRSLPVCGYLSLGSMSPKAEFRSRGVDGFRGHATLKLPIRRGEPDESDGHIKPTASMRAEACLRCEPVPPCLGEPGLVGMVASHRASVAGRVSCATCDHSGQAHW
jgi:hypothetical protein